MLRTKPYLDLDHPSIACHSRFMLSSMRITNRLRKTGRLFVSSAFRYSVNIALVLTHGARYVRGTQRLFSVKYLFGEANAA